MRILMIAPEPFFEPRGTPFSEFHRIRALTDLGHQVDLVTYPFGRDVTMPGLRVFRCARPPFVHTVRIGPSAAKVPLDLSLTASAIRRGLTDSYDVIHSHEEGGVIGVVLAKLLRVPHLYDMHSSLPQQLSNFAFSGSRLLRGAFQLIERLMIRWSRVVIVICPALADTARSVDPSARIVLIENAPGSGEGEPSDADVTAVRTANAIGTTTPVVLYTGTFEAYQGLELLFAAMALVKRRRPDARLLLVGGKAMQVDAARAEAQAAGVADVTLFTGERPAQEVPAYLRAADVLVSPRSRGTNTPLKIYQYLRSGRAIVATRLLTHTQVLSDETAILTAPSPESFAEGILSALDDPARADAVGVRARALAETKYSYAAYLERTREACQALGVEPAPAAPHPGVKGVKDLV